VDHCEKVFGELLTASALALVCLIEKDESGACLSDDPLNQLDSEAGESVAMGHHNFFDCSCLNTFQKPRETFPLVVDTDGVPMVSRWCPDGVPMVSRCLSTGIETVDVQKCKTH
jgi:hypothetical protein